MILKEQDDRIADTDALERLLANPLVDARTRRRIEEQIRNLKAGDFGEAEAAYMLKVHFGTAPNWIVINDIRIEHEGLVAQIDHLLINRLLEFWVLESKRFSGGVKINEQGEFTTFFDRKPKGVSSPIEQNNRHIKILQQALDSGRVQMPSRLGLKLKPRLKSLILISRGSIGRPNAKIPGIETVIKTEQVHTTINKAMDSGNPFDLAKIIGVETLQGIGEQVLALHNPITFDWQARFAPTKPAARPAARAFSTECHSCSATVTRGVASFCEKAPDKFGGMILCMPCQTKHIPRATLPSENRSRRYPT